MKIFLDNIALAHLKTGGKKKKVFALRHIATGLYFHKTVKNYYGPENNYYTASWPMFRRSRGGFSYFLENFEKPEEWEVEEFDV